MKKIKQAFTIVELVIVIAVIAILAAVLIPTFSNIINKANLSADKQAVREMNMALAAEEAANGYVKPTDVETVMRILANAGYNSENWICLTTGYEVYWCKQENRLILYNASTAQVEYPTEYDAAFMVNSTYDFFIYNDNQVKAQQFDIDLGSITNSSGNDITGAATITSAYSVTTEKRNEDANLQSMQSAIANENIKQSIYSATATQAYASSNTVDSSTVYIYATREVTSAKKDNNNPNAYASLQVSSVGLTEDPTGSAVLTSTGELKENMFYLTIIEEPGCSEEQKAAAKKAAGQYVYNLFSKITSGALDGNVTIIIEAGTTLDCSSCEWAPCKMFSGYFGTPNGKVTIDGARITNSTGHSQTVQFTGSEVKDANGNTTGHSKYFVTGFFGAIYGDTTIENVTFKNLNIDQPATDFSMTLNDVSRNTVAIIGGIVDARTKSSDPGVDAKVTLRNLVVESSCQVTGSASAGGLVGYIGSSASGKLEGTILIDNCKVHCNVSSTAQADPTIYSRRNYHQVGGIVSFMLRCNAALQTTIKNTEFDGTLSGPSQIGVCVGTFFTEGGKLTIDGGDYSQAKIPSPQAGVTRVGALLCTGNGFDGAINNLTISDLTEDKIISSVYAALVYGFVTNETGVPLNENYANSKNILGQKVKWDAENNKWLIYNDQTKQYE